MADFDRSLSPFSRSLAASRYRVDSDTTNIYFWVSQLAEGGLKSALRTANGTEDPVAALSIPVIYRGKLGHDVSNLRQRVSTHSRWRKLLTLVMICSALERYTQAIASLAVASDPLLDPGFPKKLDGTLLRKYGKALPSRDLTGLTKGTWGQRIATYKNLFGAVPAQLQHGEGDLEILRKARNKVAHALGVDDDHGLLNRTFEGSSLDIALGARRPDLLRHANVSDKKLISFMGTIQKVVDSIDEHLLRQFVGGYELLDLYIDWLADPDGFEKRVGASIQDHKRTHTDRFRNVLGSAFGVRKGARYVSSLESFVGKL